ncbi:MAG TPA: arginine--tRNA ligase [Candidatus Kaiserbacteria bacterium]|nr:arginine--tRNA ligase [Candidatus Kaiserbacteria bacterium]
MSIKGKIHKIVKNSLADMGAEDIDFAVEYPASLEHGDFAVNAAMVVAKKLSKNPREIADELASNLKSALGKDIISVSVAGPGFVNIKLSQSAILSELEGAVSEDEEWGKNNTRSGERVSIEYGNPNPFKEMHIGHLMGAVIGEAVSRLIESSGAVVVRDTFGGDVGPHVAKALWWLLREGITEPGSATEIGKAYLKGSNAYEKSETAKKEIDSLNVTLYETISMAENEAELQNDKRKLLAMWRTGRELSMQEHRRVFALIGTKFDYEFFDSDTVAPGMRVVNDGLKKGIFEKSDGAVVYHGEKHGLHTLVFITSRGTPTYETKDIGLAFLREEHITSGKVIIITGTEQIGHFNVVLSALSEIAPGIAKKTTHVPHGLLRLTTGKMSSRKGNVITGSGLIREVIEKALERNKDPIVAEQVAIGAIKYMILRQSPGAEIVFDTEKSLSLDGDSGPYLQYALVRAQSVLRNAEKSKDIKNIDAPILTDDAPETPYDISRLIVRFPEIVANAERLLAPNLLTTYLTELAGEWNSFYAKERIIGGEYEAYKLSLARAFIKTMTNGLAILGIEAPKKM